MLDIKELGIRAKQASFSVARMRSPEKNAALLKMADAIDADTEIILAANQILQDLDDILLV